MKTILLTILSLISSSLWAEEDLSLQAEMAQTYHKELVKPMEKKIPAIIKKLKYLTSKGSKASAKDRQNIKLLTLELKRFKYASDFIPIFAQMHKQVIAIKYKRDRQAIQSLRQLSLQGAAIKEKYPEISKDAKILQANAKAQQLYRLKASKARALERESLASAN